MRTLLLVAAALLAVLVSSLSAGGMAGGAGHAAAPSMEQGAVSYPFATLPPGSPLPSDGQCAAVMEQHRNPAFEPLLANEAANRTNVYQAGYRMPPQELGGYAARVTGDFSGTTDEILTSSSPGSSLAPAGANPLPG